MEGSLKCGTLGAKTITVPWQFGVACCPVCLPLLANSTAEEQDTTKEGIDKRAWPSKKLPRSREIPVLHSPKMTTEFNFQSVSRLCGLINDSGKCCKFSLWSFQTSTHQISDMSCSDEHISYGTVCPTFIAPPSFLKSLDGHDHSLNTIWKWRFIHKNTSSRYQTYFSQSHTYLRSQYHSPCAQ